MDVIKIMDSYADNQDIIKLSNNLLFDLSLQSAQIADILN